MKRILFPLLVLCALLASGCKTEPNNNNANQNGNQNSANINQNIINGNSNGATPTPDPNKVVTITVKTDASGKTTISVSKDPIYLSRAERPTLHFDVDDQLSSTLSEVKIEFAPGKNPMAGPYGPVKGVGAGSHAPSNTQPLNPAAANGKYKYTITVTAGSDPPVVLDPDVEVGN